tara:strand:+ start:6614 stop:7213 length:600 start_codon:yes stop_codon:yes gene_type:complete
MTQKTSPKALEIIDLARLLIANGGYNGFSYADIAKALGVTNASIHYHFPAKADLVKAVVTRYREESRRQLDLAAAAHDDPVQLLRLFIQFWEHCLHDGPLPFCICVMLASELPLIPDAVADEVQGHFDDLSGWLTTVMERAEARCQVCLQAGAKAEARMLMTLVHGSMISARAARDPACFGATAWPALERLLINAPAAP